MLFMHPRKWTQSAVGSWWHFAFVAMTSVAFVVYALNVAANSGFRSELSVALIPITCLLFFLYALRRMYRQASGLETEGNDV